MNTLREAITKVYNNNSEGGYVTRTENNEYNVHDLGQLWAEESETEFMRVPALYPNCYLGEEDIEDGEHGEECLCEECGGMLIDSVIDSAYWEDIDEESYTMLKKIKGEQI